MKNISVKFSTYYLCLVLDVPLREYNTLLFDLSNTEVSEDEIKLCIEKQLLEWTNNIRNGNTTLKKCLRRNLITELMNYFFKVIGDKKWMKI